MLVLTVIIYKLFPLYLIGLCKHQKLRLCSPLTVCNDNGMAISRISFFGLGVLALAQMSACTPRQTVTEQASIFSSKLPALVVSPVVEIPASETGIPEAAPLSELSLIPGKAPDKEIEINAGLPSEETDKPYQVGKASYYGPGFHGKKTASGTIFDMRQLVAAHPTLPFGTMVRVINQKNHRTINVRIVDRGPVARIVKQGVIIDLSKGAAEKLGFIKSGRTPIALHIISSDKVKANKLAQAD